MSRDVLGERVVALTLIGLGVMALALSGCGSATEADEAHDALRRWQVGGLRSYVYVVNGYGVTEDGRYFGTSGVYSQAGDWRVVVENEKVTSVKSVSRGVLVDARLENMTALLKHVIAFMEDGQHRSDMYEATFDERWGYVKAFSIGEDVFVTLNLSCFEPGTTPDLCPVSTIPVAQCAGEPMGPLTLTPSQFITIDSDNCPPFQRVEAIADSADLVCCAQ